VDIVNRRLAEIHPYENNPRFNDEAVDAVAASIQEFGFKVPIVLDSEGVIVAGHTRWKAALKLQLETVPCVVADDLTPEQIKAFRHDIKNHLSVLGGLLNGGKLEEGKDYLKKLEAASDALSFPYQTGNPVVDILLGEKLGLARTNGIAAEVSVLLPRSCEIDDFDLCVIFANALDNAVSACQSAAGDRRIRIAGERQGDFYMLTFENTCSGAPLPPAGTGLSNIKSAAEKYRGAVLAEKEGQRFSLNVLLNIS